MIMPNRYPVINPEHTLLIDPHDIYSPMARVGEASASVTSSVPEILARTPEGSDLQSAVQTRMLRSLVIATEEGLGSRRIHWQREPTDSRESVPKSAAGESDIPELAGSGAPSAEKDGESDHSAASPKTPPIDPPVSGAELASQDDRRPTLRESLDAIASELVLLGIVPIVDDPHLPVAVENTIRLLESIADEHASTPERAHSGEAGRTRWLAHRLRSDAAASLPDGFGQDPTSTAPLMEYEALRVLADEFHVPPAVMDDIVVDKLELTNRRAQSGLWDKAEQHPSIGERIRTALDEKARDQQKLYS